MVLRSRGSHVPSGTPAARSARRLLRDNVCRFHSILRRRQWCGQLHDQGTCTGMYLVGPGHMDQNWPPPAGSEWIANILTIGAADGRAATIRMVAMLPGLKLPGRSA